MVTKPLSTMKNQRHKDLPSAPSVSIMMSMLRYLLRIDKLPDLKGSLSSEVPLQVIVVANLTCRYEKLHITRSRSTDHTRPIVSSHKEIESFVFQHEVASAVQVFSKCKRMN